MMDEREKEIRKILKAYQGEGFTDMVLVQVDIIHLLSIIDRLREEENIKGYCDICQHKEYLDADNTCAICTRDAIIDRQRAEMDEYKATMVPCHEVAILVSEIDILQARLEAAEAVAKAVMSKHGGWEDPENWDEYCACSICEALDNWRKVKNDT